MYISQKLEMALEIIGEKEEEIDSLQSDLDMLKKTYRQHIDMLSSQSK